MLHTSKQYPSQDATAFHVFGRVMSGTSKLDLQPRSIVTNNAWTNVVENICNKKNK